MQLNLLLLQLSEKSSENRFVFEIFKYFQWHVQFFRLYDELKFLITVVLAFYFLILFRPVTSWIDTRKIQSERANLTILFDKYVPPCLDAIKTQFKTITPIPDSTMVQVCLKRLMHCVADCIFVSFLIQTSCAEHESAMFKGDLRNKFSCCVPTVAMSSGRRSSWRFPSSTLLQLLSAEQKSVNAIFKVLI